MEEGTLLESTPVHSGRIVNLSLDRVRFPDGSVGTLEMIRHSGASAVLPILDPLPHPDPRILLIHQYRYAGGGYLYEVPAGRPNQTGEPWEECARRELEEETGYTAGKLVPLTSILTTPGFTDERIHLFLATDLQPGQCARDEDEFISLVEVRLSEALAMIGDGRIPDAKTICTLLYASRYCLGG
ncbi:MAG: NUDIX hydrolase [Gemmatimonadota bacterium]|jgi:ADP-ribose pyrophosphatase|nr:NUDIX hydrolase [Gemmatimonadota bacterium]